MRRWLVGATLALTPVVAFAAPDSPVLKASPLEESLRVLSRWSADGTETGRAGLVRLVFESPSARVRAQAAEALAKRQDRDEAVGSILWKWSNSNNDRTVAYRAARALGRIPSPRTEKALWIRREHEDPRIAFAVRAAWLATARSPSAFDTMANWVRTDPSVFVRVLCARAIARLGGDKAASALWAAAAAESSALVRDSIATALLDLPRPEVEAEFHRRLAPAKNETRARLLWVAALWKPSPSAVLATAVADALKTKVPDAVAAALTATTPTPETIAAARERLGDSDVVIRDAAVLSWTRQLATRPDEHAAAAADGKVPLHARIALIASLADVPTPAALAAIDAVAKAPPANEEEGFLTATAVGALRRSRAPGAKDALFALRSGSGLAKALVDSIQRAQGEATRPRAVVVQGRLDRIEECLPGLGYEVKVLPSANDLASIQLTPEDAVLFDGPGDLETKSLRSLRLFLCLGGSVVLGSGLENLAMRRLLPDAVNPTPPDLNLVFEPTRRASAITDQLVYPAHGIDPSQAASIDPLPSIMVVPWPVPPRTVAAKPVLWSAEMEVENHVTGCVAAEVRVGCGRVLASGAVMGLRASDSAEGWFNRVRIDRSTGSTFALDEAARRRVAYDWFGLRPDRIVVLAQRGYFTSNDLDLGMAELPAARFLGAWLAAAGTGR